MAVTARHSSMPAITSQSSSTALTITSRLSTPAVVRGERSTRWPGLDVYPATDLYPSNG